MMISKHSIASLAILFAALWSGRGQAQAIYSEDFTGIKSNNDWYFFNGACLTAGTSTSTASPGTIPGCVTVLSTYYSTRSDRDPSMVGGNSGCLGSSPSGTPATCPSVQVADPVGGGALRFTNGSPYGHNENGAIVSKDTFGSGQGLQISFKTITYRGNTSSGGDGADGISFFLMDGNQPAGLGAFGGSLAYSCANNNSPYDGLKGGYIGLGIDEWGNFLNGSTLVPGYTGPNVASGDNTAYGYGYKPGRIGLRGAGSISWSALTAAYGTDPGDSTKPYYPASLATTCSNGGVYSASTNSCGQACSTGYYNSGANTCDVCTVGTFNSGTNTCNSCRSGVYSAATNSCSPAAL
jgi:type IV pilus assembly protein PilY1